MRAFNRAAIILGFAYLIAPVPSVLAQASNAVVSTAGVTVEIDTDAWTGEPSRFDKVLPVLVRVTNDGDVPLRVRHTQFSLVTESGERVLATQPFDLRAKETMVAGAANYDGFYPYGFGFHPHSFGFHRFGHFGGFNHFGGFSSFGYPYSPFGNFGRFRTVELPTSDMVSAALPEAVVEPGDRVTGFVYFVDDDDHVDLDHAGRVDFRAELVNAQTREPIDAMGIALLAKSDRLEIADRRES